MGEGVPGTLAPACQALRHDLRDKEAVECQELTRLPQFTPLSIYLSTQGCPWGHES